MGQDLSRIASVYDVVAEEYAKEFSGEHEKKPRDQQVLLEFAQKIGRRSPVWDLGCGPGHTASYLKNLGVDISGLDLSAKILEQARLHHPDIHFQEGNILDLEFNDDSLAGVVAFYSMVHFTEGQIEVALSEIYRVLQPQGILLLTYHVGSETIHLEEFLNKQIDVDFMFCSTDFISSSLTKIGFTGIEISEREPYPGVEYQSRRAYVFARKPIS